MRLTILTVAACVSVGTARARTLEVGADKEFKQPSAAIGAAKAGDTVSIQPGEYFDCSMLRVNKLTVEGVGDAAKVVITDKTCGGKGLFVVSGNDTVIRNLTLARARVPDGNGAGIRNEAPNLTVDHVRFVNNQNGLLSTPGEGGTVIVKDSVFDRNGSCINSGGCSHGIYANTTKLLHVENTVFTGTKEGHGIKSRSERTEVIGTTIEDGEAGTSSYLIEVPNGGSLVVRDCTLEKGPQSQNHGTAISIGAEGVTQPTREITVERNKFRNNTGYGTVFVNNMTATDAMLTGNVISGGSVTPLRGDGTVSGR